MNATVGELAITAIKGFGLRHPSKLRLELGGHPGNRDFFVVDSEDKLISVTATGCFVPYWSAFDQSTRVLTIGRGDELCLTGEVCSGVGVRAHFFADRYVDGTVVEGPWSKFLSELVGQEVRLVKAHEPGGGYDVRPVTLMSRASAETLGREVDGTPLDPRRFRMLITVEGVEPFAEELLTGVEVTIGTCRLRLGGPVSRCLAVQRHPANGVKDVNALRMINQTRGVRVTEHGRSLDLGVYAEVLRAGAVQVGDELRLDSSAGS